MRVALVRWREDRDGDLTRFVPDVDLDQLDSWGVIDLRGSGKAHQSSADGVALMVAPNLDTPIPGALIDLGDDHQSRLGTTVGRVLANRLGLNLVEATPGRIAAELLTLHARADDPSKPNPLVGERRFPRSKTDQRRRRRVWCAGVLLYDELGGLVDEEMAYYAETFPANENPIHDDQDIPWESLNPSAAVFVSTFVVGVRAASSSSNLDVGVARTGVGVGSADMWASGSLWIAGNRSGGVGTVVRMSSSTGPAGYLGRISPSGGMRRITLHRMASDRALISLAASPDLGTDGIPNQTLLELRTEANGSTIAAVYNSTAYGTTDTVITEGDRGGMCFDTGTYLWYRIYAFAMGQIGEGPGGGDPDPVTGTASWTEAPDTVAASGTASPPAVTGTAAWTEDADTVTATGTATPPLVAGTAAWTETGDTTASSGVHGVSGTTAWTEQPDSITASGTYTLPTVTGTSAWVEADDTIVAAGAFNATGPTGTAAWTETDDTITAAGTHGVAGVSAWVDDDDTIVGSGTFTALVTGTAAWTETADTATAAGVHGVAGTGAWLEDSDTLVAAGAATPPLVTGTAAWVELGDVLVAVGTAAPPVGADPNPLTVTIRETGHRVVARDTGHRVTTKERR